MDTFEKLDVKKRYDLIRKEGSRLLTVSYQHFCVTLYLMEGSLFESYFNIKSLKVEKVEPAPYQQLEKYLDYITIHDLYWI